MPCPQPDIRPDTGYIKAEYLMFSYLSSNRYVYFSVTILIGIVVGAATAVLLLTMVACVCCAWCPLYKKKTPAKYRGEYLLTIFKRIISILPVILPVSGSQGGSIGYHGIKERKKSGPSRSRTPYAPIQRPKSRIRTSRCKQKTYIRPWNRLPIGICMYVTSCPKNV